MLVLRRVRIIADYQFGPGAGESLFPDTVRFSLSRTRRVSQVLDGDIRVATLRASDGLFTLSHLGARRLHARFPYPKLRVTVNSEATPFVGAGKTAFAKHVVHADPDLRAHDEVLLVDENDTLIATGRALLSPPEMHAFNKGAAVNVRQGFLGAREPSKPE
ncbi:MAG: PUA domain-containing protein [Halobacteriota archaeon]